MTDDGPFMDDQARVLEGVEIGQRITLHDEDVRQHAGGEGTK